MIEAMLSGLQSLLIIEPQPMMRFAIRDLVLSLSSSVSIECVGTLTEAVAMLDAGREFSLIMFEPDLPDARPAASFAALSKFTERSRCVALSAGEDPMRSEGARAHGCVGYLEKTAHPDAIAQSLRSILGGQSVFPAQDANYRSAFADEISALSPGQLRVLAALADGALNKEIAHDLKITEATVKSHLTTIFRRIGVANRTQALLAFATWRGRMHKAGSVRARD